MRWASENRRWSTQLTLTPSRVPTVYDRSQTGIGTRLSSFLLIPYFEFPMNTQDLQKILDSLPDPVVLTDRHGIIVRVNARIKDVFGYEPDELIGKEIEILVPEDRRTKHHNEREAYGQIPNSRPMGGNLTLMARARDGTEIPVEISLSPYETSDGIRIISVIHDMSVHARLEKSIHESENRYRSLVDLSPEAIIVHTLGDIVYANDAAARLLSVPSRDELIGKSFLGFIPSPYLEEVKRRIQSVPVPGQRREPLLVKTARSDGQTCYLEAISGHVSYGGKPAAQVIIRDITDRILAEDELKESREQLRSLSTYLQSARESERTAIAREIHDELGGFLTAIKLELALFDDALELPDSPDKQEAIKRKLDAIASLVDDTVKSMRVIITELRPVLLESLGLSPAIEWLAEDFQRRTGITCGVTIEQGEHTPDPERATAVYRIFQETLTNVARHSGASLVDARLTCHDGMLTLIVSDNGKGISEEQIRNSRSFGLVGMRERAIPFGGTVTIQGLAGKGTTIEVRIPLA
jgi:two-component system sensor histidine kinase UhpB